MAKAPVVEESEFKHALKVASVTGQSKLRDVALLWVAYGTGVMPIELARLSVMDFLHPEGVIRTESEIRAEIAFNGIARPLYWVNRGVVAAVEAYLEERLRFNFGVDDPMSRKPSSNSASRIAASSEATGLGKDISNGFRLECVVALRTDELFPGIRFS